MTEKFIEIVAPLPPEGENLTHRRFISLKGHLIDFLHRSTSAETRAAYQRTILEFSRFVSRHLLTVTVRDVQSWRDKMLFDGSANTTVATKLTIVRSFYAYLQKVLPELEKYNPAAVELVPPPQVPNVLKGRALTGKEVRYLLAGPDKNKVEDARDYALMLLMLRLGLRVTEVGRVKQSSIQWKGRWTLSLTVKGGAEEIWPLPPDVKAAIDEYLQLDRARRLQWPENRSRDQFIFQPGCNYRTQEYNRGLTRQMIGLIVRKWAEYGGIRGNVSPHDLRRTAITRALNLGRTYREVQMMSKHKDPRTVMKYDAERDNLDRNPVNTLNYDD